MICLYVLVSDGLGLYRGSPKALRVLSRLLGRDLCGDKKTPTPTRPFNFEKPYKTFKKHSKPQENFTQMSKHHLLVLGSCLLDPSPHPQPLPTPLLAFTYPHNQAPSVALTNIKISRAWFFEYADPMFKICMIWWDQFRWLFGASIFEVSSTTVELLKNCKIRKTEGQ